MFDNLMNKLRFRVAAGLFIALLLWMSVFPGFTLEQNSKINSASSGLSSLAYSCEYVACLLQSSADFSPYGSKSLSGYSYTKRIPITEGPLFCQKSEIGNNPTGLLGPVLNSSNSLYKDLNIFYLTTDIPPPFLFV
jgi:hypothetical protein